MHCAIYGSIVDLSWISNVPGAGVGADIASFECCSDWLTNLKISKNILIVLEGARTTNALHKTEFLFGKLYVLSLLCTPRSSRWTPMDLFSTEVFFQVSISKKVM